MDCSAMMGAMTDVLSRFIRGADELPAGLPPAGLPPAGSWTAVTGSSLGSGRRCAGIRICVS